MSIWTKIKLYAEKKEREDWMSKYYCDRRCPKCDTWQANCGGWKDIQYNYPTMQCDVMTCGKCGQDTTMLDIGVGYIEADPITGYPLKNE